MRNYCRNMLLIFVLLLLEGCITTQTVGKKTSEPSQPLSKLYVVANDAVRLSGSNSAFGQSAGQTAVQNTSKAIFGTLETRLPAVFGLNGIDTTVSLKSKQKETRVNADSGYSHVMTLTPASATYSVNYGHASVEINSSIFEIASKKVIWTGGVRFNKAGMATVDAKSGDEFGRALLLQLNKDGIITLPSAEPKMPN